jgi:hypothetical protein
MECLTCSYKITTITQHSLRLNMQICGEVNQDKGKVGNMQKRLCKRDKA